MPKPHSYGFNVYLFGPGVHEIIKSCLDHINLDILLLRWWVYTDIPIHIFLYVPSFQSGVNLFGFTSPQTWAELPFRCKKNVHTPTQVMIKKISCLCPTDEVVREPLVCSMHPLMGWISVEETASAWQETDSLGSSKCRDDNAGIEKN